MSTTLAEEDQELPLLQSRDVTVTSVMVNHGKIPDGGGYLLSFNYHGNRCGQ